MHASSQRVSGDENSHRMPSSSHETTDRLRTPPLKSKKERPIASIPLKTFYENVDTEADVFSKMGRLLRRDRRFPTWKWRDFVLERDRLQYFSVKGSRKREIPINESTPISIRKIDTLRPHSFIIYIKSEKITLAAGSELERDSWIDIFQTHFHANIEIVSPQTGEKMKKKPAFVQLPDANPEFSEEIKRSRAWRRYIQCTSIIDSGDEDDYIQCRQNTQLGTSYFGSDTEGFRHDIWTAKRRIFKDYFSS